MAQSIKSFFDRYDRRNHRLQLKFAKDPKHKHVRELIGTVGPVGGKKTRIYWCKQCHAMMPKTPIKTGGED